MDFSHEYELQRSSILLLKNDSEITLAESLKDSKRHEHGLIVTQVVNKSKIVSKL